LYIKIRSIFATMNKVFITILSATAVLAAMVLLNEVAAQPGPGPGPTGGPGGPPGGGPPPCWPPPCIPIDGGVGFLVAAGLALGGKKAYDAMKTKKQEVLKENSNDTKE
jgi:hypothetical protein